MRAVARIVFAYGRLPDELRPSHFRRMAIERYVFAAVFLLRSAATMRSSRPATAQQDLVPSR